MSAWQKVLIVLGFMAVMVAGCVLALSRAAEAADVTGWKVTCPGSLNVPGGGKAMLSCTVNYPADHSKAQLDSALLYKQGQTNPLVYIYHLGTVPPTTKIASPAGIWTAKREVYDNVVAHGDTLEVRVYDYFNASQYRKLMATSNPIAISNSGTTPPPPTSGNFSVKITRVKIRQSSTWIDVQPGQTATINFYSSAPYDEIEYCWGGWTSSADPDMNDQVVLAITGSGITGNEYSTNPVNKPTGCARNPIGWPWLLGATLEARYQQRSGANGATITIKAVSAEKVNIR